MNEKLMLMPPFLVGTQIPFPSALPLFAFIEGCGRQSLDVYLICIKDSLASVIDIGSAFLMDGTYQCYHNKRRSYSHTICSNAKMRKATQTISPTLASVPN